MINISEYNYISEIPSEEAKRYYRKWVFDIRRGRYTFVNVWDDDSRKILNNEFVSMFRDDKLTDTDLLNIVDSYVSYINRLKLTIDVIPDEFKELVKMKLEELVPGS